MVVLETQRSPLFTPGKLKIKIWETIRGCLGSNCFCSYVNYIWTIGQVGDRWLFGENEIVNIGDVEGIENLGNLSPCPPSLGD